MAYDPTWQTKHRSALHTQKWIQRRNEYIQDHGYHCEYCGATKNLELHHMAYDHEIGTEPDEDLILLCDECHNNMHADTQLSEPTQRAELAECKHCYRLNKEGETKCEYCKKIM